MVQNIRLKQLKKCSVFIYSRAFIPVLVTVLVTSCKKHDTIPMSLSVAPVIDTVGGTITITGSGFSTNPTSNVVQFNDSTMGQVLAATSTQLTVMVPPYVARDRIKVKYNGVQAETAQVFEIAPKFDPKSEAPGYPINIITGGSTNLSDYRVSFNGVPAAPSGIFQDEITVNVPAGAISGKITVTYKGVAFTSLVDFNVSPVGTVSTVTNLGSFSTPTDLAFDQTGNLFVSDLEGGVIDKINTVNGAVSLYVGNGSYNSNGGSPLTSAGIYGAGYLAFAPDGVLYAADGWYGQLFRITADSATSFYPFGPNLSTLAIYIDNAGNFYVSEGLQIKKISAGGAVSVLAGQGTQGILNGPAATALFEDPVSLTQDAAGNLYIADASQIRLLSNGYVSTFAGGGNIAGFHDGSGLNASFTDIGNIIRDPVSGNIYATDPGDHVVRMITPAGIVTTIAGNPGHQGTQDGKGAAALFQGPAGIAIDKNGDIYVSDGSYATSCIRKIKL